jgi:hypothetical protein
MPIIGDHDRVHGSYDREVHASSVRGEILGINLV